MGCAQMNPAFYFKSRESRQVLLSWTLVIGRTKSINLFQRRAKMCKKFIFLVSVGVVLLLMISPVNAAVRQNEVASAKKMALVQAEEIAQVKIAQVVDVRLCEATRRGGSLTIKAPNAVVAETVLLVNVDRTESDAIRVSKFPTNNSDLGVLEESSIGRLAKSVRKLPISATILVTAV
jgi:hypothetical protein